MEPILLKPAGKDYLWGGIRLKNEYNKHFDMVPLAETWECSTHPDGLSVVASGKYKGKTLSEVINIHPEYLGSKNEQKGELPIMIKFINAEKDLSIQVHPSDEYARKNENQNGKTEMWYVLDAEPGATLIYGFAHNITPKQLKKSIETGDILKHLQKVSISKGDVFFIPAGLIHSIGKGTIIAEIQEKSNLTYRVYDYNRKDKTGKKRELHIEKAIDVLNMKADVSVSHKSKCINYFPGYAKEFLCRCKYFEVERIQMVTRFSFDVSKQSFQVLLCLEGNGDIITENRKKISFKKGDCIFIPAGIGLCNVIGKTNFLKIRC